MVSMFTIKWLISNKLGNIQIYKIYENIQNNNISFLNQLILFTYFQDINIYYS